MLKESKRHAMTDMGCILYFGNGIGYYHEGELGKNPPEFLMLNEVNDKN